jgi:hypothetical protein
VRKGDLRKREGGDRVDQSDACLLADTEDDTVLFLYNGVLCPPFCLKKKSLLIEAS